MPMVRRNPYLLLCLLLSMAPACVLDRAGTKSPFFDDTSVPGAPAEGSSSSNGQSAPVSGDDPPLEGLCGDGLVQGVEACDDANDDDPNDGCDGCVIAPGYRCLGEPSVCTVVPADQVTLGPDLAHNFPANAYDGSFESMECLSMNLVAAVDARVRHVELSVGIATKNVGDLVLKLRRSSDPDGPVVTLLSRAGMDESEDDGWGDSSDNSNLSSAHPIRFRDDAVHDAEDMGRTISSHQAVCQADGQCEFAPNAGAAIAGSLDAFNGLQAHGLWELCVADAAGSEGGVLDEVRLEILSW